MKILFACDLHGDRAAVDELLKTFERERADRLVLLGDILYHGPRNDLPRAYDPKGVIALLNGKKDVILAVRGNCDTEVDQMVLDFPILADYAVLPLPNGGLAYLTHGHRYNEETPPPMTGTPFPLGAVAKPFSAVRGPTTSLKEKDLPFTIT